jgi:hypothetical protein
MSTFQAGAASVVITPPVGTWLEGYGGRTSGSLGVHDDLHASAIVVDDGATQAAVVSCDLIGIDRHTTGSVRALVAEATDIPGAHVMVAATHTHAGPRGMHRRDDEAMRDVMNRLVAGAIVEAWRNKRPSVLKAGRGSVNTVSQNRRDPAGPTDDTLRVLLLDGPDRRKPPIASVMNFACHATVLYRTNMEISADYPGHATATVQKITGDAPSLFLQGACGDVNPTWIEQDHDETARVGSIVGAEAARRIQELRPLGHGERVWNIRWDEILERPNTTGVLIEPRIRVGSRHVPVRLRAFGALDEYDARLAALRKEQASLPANDVEAKRGIVAQITRLQGERVTAEQIRGAAELNAEVQAISLGPDCAIVSLPGEFFVETGRAIQVGAGVKHLLVACYTNHHLMYVPPKHEFERGGYEPGVAILEEDSEAAFRTAAIDLLREVAVK